MKTKFRLFKRDDHGRTMDPAADGFRDRPWYFLFEFRKTRYLRCLQTPDAALAQAAAKNTARQIRDALIRGDLQAVQNSKLRQTAPATLAQVIALYEVSGVDAGKKTRAANLGSLRLVLRTAEGRAGAPPPAGEDWPVTVISAATVRQYYAAQAAAIAAAPDQNAANTLKRSANSRLNQARCVFAPKARALYEEKGLEIPHLEEFLRAYQLHKFGRLPAQNYNPPSDAVIQRTLTAWEQIEDRELFLAVGHELAFGLRAGELGQAKWSWWTVRQGYPVLDGVANVKNGSGLVQVRALDPWFHTLAQKIAARNWRGPDDDYILAGHVTQRTDATFRCVSDWLRQLGWQTQKTNHALRAYAGSQVAMKYGIYEAATWLRHSTVKVTEQHYSHFVQKFRPANLDDLPARWATTTPAPLRLSIVA